MAAPEPQPEPAASAQPTSTSSPHAAVFATTEHFALQSARSTTVAEANGRANIYLATLSGNVVALALVGEASELGSTFYLFALLLLPATAFVGTVTFLRLVQLSAEDLAYAQRIARLRSYYLFEAPELRSCLQTAHQRGDPLRLDGRDRSPSAPQLLLTVAGMVAVLNSVVCGVAVGISVEALAMQSRMLPIAGGVVAGVAALTTQEHYHRQARDRLDPENVDTAALTTSR